MAIELANHIYRDGEGVPVVLMNAYPVDHRMWDVCAKALADFADLNDVPDFPIWAPDMAGSGACRATPIRAPAWRTARTARRWIAWPEPTWT
jgi:pimeloyl-ACP methyl ester carboxylesterase